MPVDLALPGVIGRAVHTEHAAGLRDRRALRLSKQLQAVAEQHVILGHAAPTPLPLGGEGGSLSRGPDGPRQRRGPSSLTGLSHSQLSGALGVSPA